MRKKKSNYLLTAFVIAGSLLFLRNIFIKDMIVLENGTIIVAEDTWISGHDVFYRDNKGTGYAEEGDIRQIYVKGFHGPRDFQKRIVCYLTATAKSIGNVLSENRDKVGEQKALLGIIALIGLSVCVAIFFFIKVYSKIGKSDKAGISDTVKTTSPFQPALTSIQTVQAFFLNLFRRQLGITEDAPFQIVTIPGRLSDSRQVYELKVKHKDEWKSRRMTISPLGEGTGSKSQCFYVIYDTHIVVKIPPVPIKDLKDYIRRIREETAIVTKLSPIECIIPGISVILKKIRALPDNAGFVSKTIEEQYINWLEMNPDFQDFLKVGDAFVFFMDLSRYYFLSHVMDGLHDVETQIHTEIAADVDVVWNYHGFESKYGDMDDAVCFSLQNLYDQFDEEVRQTLKMTGYAKSLGDTQKKMLFLNYLAGKDSAEIYRDLPDQMVEKVNLPLRKITAENSAVTEKYKELVNTGIRKRMFKRNKPQMEGIITNLLVLLASMGEKKVAMRDLKPDNLIVAGDPANYPTFLFSAEDYTIGLIDVETAIDFETTEKKTLGQPHLGGTPLYATPSHFFVNTVLNDVYADLPKILHLQDWHAVVAIIYELATGGRLFGKTGAKVRGFMERIQKSLTEKRNMADVYKEISHIFWMSAKEEFNIKVNKAENLLKALNPVIPERIRKWFEIYLRERNKTVDTRIKALIQSQTHFQSGKNRQALLQYSHEDICRLKAKYKKPGRPSKMADEKAISILQLLDDLARLKMESERLGETMKAIKRPFPKLSAHDTLVIMFDVVVDTMYQPEWETISTEPVEIEVSEEEESGLGYTLTIQAPS